MKFLAFLACMQEMISTLPEPLQTRVNAVFTVHLELEQKLADESDFALSVSVMGTIVWLFGGHLYLNTYDPSPSTLLSVFFVFSVCTIFVLSYLFIYSLRKNGKAIRELRRKVQVAEKDKEALDIMSELANEF